MKQIQYLIFFFLAFFLATACTSEKEPLATVAECNGNLSIAAATEVNSNCGLEDGSFTIDVTGGSGNYTYQIGLGSTQSSPIFSGLAAGVYTVNVTDSELGCTAQVELQVRNSNGVNATLSTTASNCDAPIGTIELVATDGVEPYQYKLGDGSFQSEASFSNLSPGDYSVTVRDANGCEIELEADVESTVIFGDIKSIVQANCAVSGCHNGTISPDFREDSNITGRSSRIRARTSSRTMPPSNSGRTLSNEEIAEIVCWVNDGAPGN